MRRLSALVIAGMTLSIPLGCSGPGPTPSPVPTPLAASQTAPPPTSSPTSAADLQSGPITFNDVGAEGTAVTTYTELGFTVTVVSGSWVVGATYGNPRPFIRIDAQAGTTVTGDIQVAAGGVTFSFTSVDLYSSTTPIPYTITGLRNSASVFTLSGTVPNTFGQFRTVTGAGPAAVIDTLRISLTNSAAPCCNNPMGLDNITLAK